MIPYHHIASDSLVLAGVGSYAQVHIPRAVFGGFQLPAGFGHHAAASDVRLPDICLHSGGRNGPIAFSVEFVIPSQAAVVVVPAGPVVQPGPNPQQAAVQVIQLVVRIPASAFRFR